MAKYIQVRLPKMTPEDVPSSFLNEWAENLRKAFQEAIPQFLDRFNILTYKQKLALPAAENQPTGRGLSGSGLSGDAQMMRAREKIMLGGSAYIRGLGDAAQSGPRMDRFFAKGKLNLREFLPNSLAATGISFLDFPSIMAGIIHFLANRALTLSPEMTTIFEDDAVQKIPNAFVNTARAATQQLFTKQAVILMALLAAQIDGASIGIALAELRTMMVTTLGVFVTGGPPAVLMADFTAGEQLTFRVQVA